MKNLHKMGALEIRHFHQLKNFVETSVSLGQSYVEKCQKTLYFEEIFVKNHQKLCFEFEFIFRANRLL